MVYDSWAKASPKTKDVPLEFIAEISCNHMGDLANAVDLIGYAKAAGVNTVKFQYFDPHKMCTEYATPLS